MQPERKGKARKRDLHALSNVSIFDVVNEWLCLPGNGNLRNLQEWVASLRSRRGDKLVALADALVAAEYGDAAEHKAAHQLAALVRKYPFSSSEAPGLNPEAAAILKFRKAELVCKRYNRLFRLRNRTNTWRHQFIIGEARAWIERVLGREPDLDKIYDQCEFGPGASVGVHGNATNDMRKFLASSWSCTPTAVPYVKSAMWRNHHVVEYLLSEGVDPGIFCLDREAFDRMFVNRLKLVAHNKVTFVPKTAKTHRVIAVEPLLNLYLQRGVDVVMRRKLRRFGVDLSQQTHNQGFAFLGSVEEYNPYATLDLSAASDSISIELARTLLPSAWFTLLNDIRSPSYLDPQTGKFIRYEKFCSMGNSFCFPLETLIFASFAHAVNALAELPDDFSIYGDDIIVRQSQALVLTELLQYIGFSINTDKSFYFGPFRESCGRDYFRGVFVRPVSLDYRLDNTMAMFKFHNSFARRGNIAFAESLKLTDRVRACFRFMRYMPGNLDSAFEVPKDVFMSNRHVRWNSDQQRWAWKELIQSGKPDPIPLHEQNVHVLVLMAALKGSPSSQPYTLRRMTRTRVRTI